MQKKQNQQEKTTKVAKAGNDECREKFHHCCEKNSRQVTEDMSQQSDPCRDKHLEESLRKKQKSCRDISKLCHDTVKAKDNLKNVMTFHSFVTTYYVKMTDKFCHDKGLDEFVKKHWNNVAIENILSRQLLDRVNYTLSRHFIALSRQRKEEGKESLL